MRAYEFKNPIKEMKIVEVVPAINTSGGRVGQPMGAAHRAGHQAGQAATGGRTTNVATKIGSKVEKGTEKSVKKAQGRISKAVLSKGQQIAIPTQGGKETEFNIDDVDGDMITLANPNPKDGEPHKFVYHKGALDKVVKAKADQITQSTGVPGGGKIV
ncbi:uncharacterized protein METZ01_LOCUS257881 [marine metagenome]|uniref:Uncharacterized protein n=1 Tax=marine metagenome TaxID=408172 RepID=A0A382J0U8_9ZZZZ